MSPFLLALALAAPATPAPGPAAGGDTAAVRWLLVDWRDAWERRDVDAFVDCYAASFRSGDLDREALRAHKRQVFAAAGAIRVDMEAIGIRVEGDQAVVSFVQTYRSEAYTDSGIKTLEARREGERWRIVAERFEPR